MPNNRGQRCNHIKVNGMPCASPALLGRERCYFHNHMRKPNPGCVLPLIEDANAIQMAIMEVLRGAMDGLVDPKLVGKLLYGLQIAAGNGKNARFNLFPQECQELAMEDPDRVKSLQPRFEGEHPINATLDRALAAHAAGKKPVSPAAKAVLDGFNQVAGAAHVAGAGK